MRACIVDIPTHATHQRQPSKVDNLKEKHTEKKYAKLTTATTTTTTTTVNIKPLKQKRQKKTFI